MTEPQTPPPLEMPTIQPEGPKKPVWPIPIGIISVTLAGLGLFFGLYQLINVKDNLQQSPGMTISFPEWFSTFSRISAGAGTLWSALLLAGGILLLRRRRSARPLHMAYALLAILFTLVGAAAGMAVAGSVEVSDPKMEGPIRIGMYAGAIFGNALALVYPVFLLAWFSRAKIRLATQEWA